MNTRRDGEKSLVLIVATAGSFLIPFMSSSINVALPSIGEDLGMDAVLLGWVSTAYLVAAAIFLVPLGRIADIHGRKRIFTYGIALYTLSSLFSALSLTPAMLILFRIFQGIGGAMIFGTGVAILTSVFPPGERGRTLGINVAAVYLGLSAGPFAGGLLTEHFGWRSIFVVNVPLGLLLFAFILWKLNRDWAGARGERFDLPGSILYGIMLGAIMYGFSLLPAIWGGGLILVGILALLGFVRRESRARNPVLDLKLFRNNPAFAFSNLAALINYSATFAVAFLLSLYLQYVKGLSPQSAGMLLVTQPVVQAAFSPISGRLSDKVEPRILASLGMALTVAGLFLFSFLNRETSLAFVLGGLILLGFGFALFSSPNTNAIMSSVENRYYGVASAILATMRQVGMTLSMGVALMIFALYIGRVQITPEYSDSFVQSMKVAFTLFSCFCFAGIFASLARGKVRG